MIASKKFTGKLFTILWQHFQEYLKIYIRKTLILNAEFHYVLVFVISKVLSWMLFLPMILLSATYLINGKAYCFKTELLNSKFMNQCFKGTFILFLKLISSSIVLIYYWIRDCWGYFICFYIVSITSWFLDLVRWCKM